MKKKGSLLIIFLISMLVFGWFVIQNKIVKEAENVVVSNLELASIDDGIYMGEYTLSPVKVMVQVEIKNHKIESIEILEHVNGFGKKAEAINAPIIDQQTLKVDLVSGASVSSKVILKAIDNALNK